MRRSTRTVLVLLILAGLVDQTSLAQTWEWVNPLPQGNWLNDVEVFNDATALAVGGASTVMKTNDGGESWQIEHFVLDLSVEFNAVSFFDENKGIIVGGNGTILQTFDAGQTWDPITSGVTVSLTDVFCIDDSTAVVVGDEGMMLKSTDVGQSWFPLNSGIQDKLLALDFLNDTLGIATGDNAVILRTEDGGQTWTEQESGHHVPLNGVFIHDENKAIAVGSFGLIFTTENGGKDWMFNQLEASQDSWLNDITFLNAVEGFVINDNGGVFRTTDGGNTWLEQETGTKANLSAIDFQDGVGFVVGVAGTILSTRDKTNWVNHSSGFRETLTKIVFTSPTKGLATSTSGDMLVTEDAGESWLVREIDDVGLNSVFFVSQDTGIAVGSMGKIFRTVDGGSRWQLQVNRSGTILNDVFFVDPDTGFAIGFQGIILRSTDGGTTWSDQMSNAGDEWLEAIDFASPKDGVIVGTSGMILHTEDTGQSWAVIESGTNERLNDIEFVNDTTGFIVGRGSSNLHIPAFIMRTRDAGKTWEQLESNTENTLLGVDFVDETTGIAVGQNGTILWTNNRGESWHTQRSTTTEWLRDIFVTEQRVTFVVGQHGVILRGRLDEVVSVEALPSSPNNDAERELTSMLLSNYPNPFNRTTKIEFQLPAPGRVHVELFNTRGQSVLLALDDDLPTGRHVVPISADRLASGVYYYRVVYRAFGEHQNRTETGKILLLK